MKLTDLCKSASKRVESESVTRDKSCGREWVTDRGSREVDETQGVVQGVVDCVFTRTGIKSVILNRQGTGSRGLTKGPEIQ